MPLGESRFDVALRVKSLFGTLMRDYEKHKIDKVVIVSHGVTIRAFIMQWCHKTPEWFEEERNPNNCSIIRISQRLGGGYDHGVIYTGG